MCLFAASSLLPLAAQAYAHKHRYCSCAARGDVIWAKESTRLEYTCFRHIPEPGPGKECFLPVVPFCFPPSGVTSFKGKTRANLILTLARSLPRDTLLSFRGTSVLLPRGLSGVLRIAAAAAKAATAAREKA